MSLNTFSSFYYGHEITSENKYLDFDEGGAELTAELKIGSYSLTDFLAEVKRALDVTGALTYTLTVDRDTRIITVSATGTFSILAASGSHASTSCLGLVGFTVDKTGNTSYAGNVASGSTYEPQYKLQSYVSADDYKSSIDPTVNVSSNGEIEVVKFGTVSYVELNIMYATNLPMDDVFIKNNPSGLDDLRDFMQYLIKRAPIEFNPDENDTSDYLELTLDKSGESDKGTAYKLREMYGRGLPQVYETGTLKFRVIE